MNRNGTVLKKFVIPAVIMTLAALVYALSYVLCFDPNSIAFGGLTGVAQIINRLFPQVPVGVTVIVLNIPLFLLGWKFLGGKLLVSSLYTMFISSLFIDLLTPLYPWPTMDPLLASIFGGLLMGGALGFIFLQGATTGGTDIAARLLKLKLAWLPMGKLVMAVELAIIVLTAVFFRSLDTALYGFVGLYVATVSMDAVIYGADQAKVAYVISDRDEEVCAAISRDLGRGITILHGQGAYTGNKKNVLMCAFKQREIAAIKAAVKEADPDAFLIVCDAHEVLGDGFRTYRKNDL